MDIFDLPSKLTNGAWQVHEDLDTLVFQERHDMFLSFLATHQELAEALVVVLNWLEDGPEQFQDLTYQNENLKDGLEVICSELNNYYSKAFPLTGTSREQQGWIDDVVAEIRSDLETEVSDLESVTQDLRNEIKDLEDKVEDLEGTVTYLKEQREELNERIKELEAELEEARNLTS